MEQAPRWVAVAVDLDGTLIRGTTASLHLAEWIGHRPIIEELERQFAAGAITSADIADGDAPFYKGRSLEDVAAAMESVPYLDDIAEGVGLLASQGVDAVLCTVAWTFAARCVADRFGFSSVSGTIMRVDTNGKLDGQVERYFEPEDKAAFLHDYCHARGVQIDQVVAIGDGRSDLAMFAAAGFSVGMNASPEARAAASVTVDSNSFIDALRAVPGLLTR